MGSLKCEYVSSYEQRRNVWYILGIYQLCGRVEAVAEPQERRNLGLGVGNFILNRISRLMRYAKLSCTEFYSCYLQQCLSIDLFSYRTPGSGQKGPINKVCLSFCLEIFLELTLQFLWNSAWCQGPMWCCARQPEFLKIMFRPKNGKNRPSVGFFECIGKFSFYLLIAVCLNKSNFWENSGS